jgi:hypothetical protein
MSVLPTIPAIPRDKIAVGTPPAETPYLRTASARPGDSRSITLRVISGVRSCGVCPVPPCGQDQIKAFHDSLLKQRPRQTARHRQRHAWSVNFKARVHLVLRQGSAPRCPPTRLSRQRFDDGDHKSAVGHADSSRT